MYKGGSNIDFSGNSYLRNLDNKSPFHTPVMDQKHQDKIPSMRTYDNWPSTQTVKENKKLFVEQKEQIGRLMPTGTTCSPDPIAKEVERYRMVKRAGSTVKATKGTFSENPIVFGVS